MICLPGRRDGNSALACLDMTLAKYLHLWCLFLQDSRDRAETSSRPFVPYLIKQIHQVHDASHNIYCAVPLHRSCSVFGLAVQPLPVR